MQERTCSIDGCERPHRAVGLCNTHYMRHARRGDVGPAELLQADPATSEREFLRLFNRITDDCIIWPHGVTSAGYGAVHFEGRKWLTHRLAVKLYTGTEPEGLNAIHGPCHNRRCMNARGGHVTWGTTSQNQLDRRRDGTARRAA